MERKHNQTQSSSIGVGTDLNQSGYYTANKTSQTLVLKNRQTNKPLSAVPERKMEADQTRVVLESVLINA